MRVVRAGRTGFAYAGTLDPGSIDRGARRGADNVAFGTVDEWAGLAEPDGVARTPQPLWDDELAAFPTERKIELAKELEQLTLAGDDAHPRRRREAPPTRGPRLPSPRRPACQSRAAARTAAT